DEREMAREAREPALGEPRPRRRQPAGALAREGGRVADAHARAARAGEPGALRDRVEVHDEVEAPAAQAAHEAGQAAGEAARPAAPQRLAERAARKDEHLVDPRLHLDRKSTRLNSSHVKISY